MQKLLERITILLKINLQDLLMEACDQQEAVAHYCAEMEGGLADAKDAAAKALAQEHQFAKRLKAAQSSIAEWDAKVDTALQAGDDEKARTALKRKESYECVANELQLKLEQLRKVIADMKASVNALQEKIQEVKKHEGFAVKRSSRSGRTMS